MSRIFIFCFIFILSTPSRADDEVVPSFAFTEAEAAFASATPNMYDEVLAQQTHLLGIWKLSAVTARADSDNYTCFRTDVIAGWFYMLHGLESARDDIKDPVKLFTKQCMGELDNREREDLKHSFAWNIKIHYKVKNPQSLCSTVVMGNILRTEADGSISYFRKGALLDTGEPFKVKIDLVTESSVINSNQRITLSASVSQFSWWKNLIAATATSKGGEFLLRPNSALVNFLCRNFDTNKIICKGFSSDGADTGYYYLFNRDTKN